MRPRRRSRRLVSPWPLATVILLALASILGFTAANFVPASKASDHAQATGADALKPADCAGISLTTIVAGSGTINGTAGNDLNIGSAGADTIDGKQGDDCILGGGGDDSLRGSGGFDVCIGGPGIDTFHPTCDVQIQ